MFLILLITKFTKSIIFVVIYVTPRPKEMRNEMKSHKWEKEKLDCIDDIRRYIRIVSFVSSFIFKMSTKCGKPST